MNNRTNNGGGRTLIELGYKEIDSHCIESACDIINTRLQRPPRTFGTAPEIMREDDGTVWLYLAEDRLLVALYAPDWKGPCNVPRIDLTWLRGLTSTIAGTATELREHLADAYPGEYVGSREFYVRLAQILEKCADELFEGAEDFSEVHAAAQLRPDQVLIAVAQATRPLRPEEAAHAK